MSSPHVRIFDRLYCGICNNYLCMYNSESKPLVCTQSSCEINYGEQKPRKRGWEYVIETSKGEYKMIKDRLGNVVTLSEIVDILKRVGGGATIWGVDDARIIRAIQENEETSNLIHVIDDLSELEYITGESFSGVGRLPYFGAITSDEGKLFIKRGFVK